ncbi:diphosphomevalonate decarboxylase, partial [Staphylococcus aureus]|nr:diphosphomevalonate decarboxylase [Staphylococcus aureus]
YPCYFTMDAGPNVKILVEKKNKQQIIDKLLTQFDNNQIIDSDIIATGIEIIE